MTEKISSLVDAYQEYLNLNYVSSRKDPEEEPFISKYIGRAVLKKELDALEQISSPDLSNDSGRQPSEFMQSEDLKKLFSTYEKCLEQLDSKCQENFGKSAKRFLICKLFEFNLAKNHVETEEIEAGERIFANIVQQLEELCSLNSNIYDPVLWNLKMSCFLELVFVWSNRGNYTKCHSLLTSIEVMYNLYRAESNSIMSFDPSELIQISLDLTVDDRKVSLESLYTYSLFYSAQIYGKLDEKVKSAEYCQITLQRQIDEHTENASSEKTDKGLDESKGFKQQPLEKISFDPLDWATHAAALSQYYVCEEDFATARHCLVSADAILVKLNNDKPKVVMEEGDDNANPNEKLNEQTHSIRRCWGKYAISLLKFAKVKILESAELPDTKSLHMQLDQPSKFHFNLPACLYDIKAIELEAITSNIPLDYEQARAVFLKAQKIMNEVKDFFVLDGYVSDHSEIIRDITELYSCLIYFDPDLDRRCKLQKRRLDLLIPICDSINEQYYLQLKRQYLFDVGSIYSEMVDLKLEILSEKQERAKENPSILDKSNAAAAVKINQLIKNSIIRFEAFLTTMKIQPARKVLPDKFDDHNVRPALLCKFYLGRLYSKIITNDTKQRIENCRLTLENYNYLTKYCDNHRADTTPEVIESMQIEYSVCKEMCTFLPAKMEKLRQLGN